MPRDARPGVPHTVRMHFAVTRVPGPSWLPGRSMREQPGWDEHAAFMDGLAARGFIVLGGPLGAGDRFHFAVEAASEEEIRAAFDDDPWVPAGLLRIASIEPWRLVLRAPGV